jgi:predicted lipid-binding transport protein (Tim44 family)
MKLLLSILAVVLTLGLFLGVGDAEAARRLGGGKSSGMQRQSTPANKAPDAKPAQTPTAPAAAAPAQPKRSWMGPLAGLAAGLGLAALASHFGFGAELASMMMMGLAVMAVLALVGLIMRRRAAAQQPQAARIGGMQYAGAGLDRAEGAPKSYDVSMPGSSIGSKLGAASSIPSEFDVAGFERNAKVQFIRLQAANDTGNLDDIREFTTPEMLADLKLDMAARGGAAQETEVVEVEAKVIDVVDEGDRYVVSVHFTGMIRESKGAAPESFDETWHLVKARVAGFSAEFNKCSRPEKCELWTSSPLNLRPHSQPSSPLTWSWPVTMPL